MQMQTLGLEAFLPATGTVPKRKVGRPKGAKGRVLQEARALGVHHFAFVRSSLLGLDLAEAFNDVKLYEQGKKQLKSAKDLLNEF